MSDPVSSPQPTSPESPPPVALSEYYRFLGAFYIYQDQLSWSRVQTVIAIEAAVLAVAFSRQGIISPLVCLLGGAAIVGVFWLMSVDREVRDQLANKMQVLHSQHGQVAALVPIAAGAKWLRKAAWVVAGINGLLFVARSVNLVATWNCSEPMIVNLMR